MEESKASLASKAGVHASNTGAIPSAGPVSGRKSAAKKDSTSSRYKSPLLKSAISPYRKKNSAMIADALSPFRNKNTGMNDSCQGQNNF